MSKLLLTGATGFLGSYLLNSFVQQKYHVVIVKRSISNTIRINHLLSKITIYNLDESSLEQIFEVEKPEVVVHVACNYGRQTNTIIDVVNTNMLLGLNLLQNVIKFNTKTMVNTDTLLPRYVNDYSLSKAHFTEWLKKYSDQVQVINLRIEHMYGPNDNPNKFVEWVINEMKSDVGKINLTSGVQKRDFIYIDDVVDAFNLVIRKRNELAQWNQFDVATNNFVTVKDFILEIASVLEEINKKDVISRLNFGAVEYRKGDVMTPDLDNRDLLELGWNPKVTLRHGIQKTLKN